MKNSLAVVVLSALFGSAASAFGQGAALCGALGAPALPKAAAPASAATVRPGDGAQGEMGRAIAAGDVKRVMALGGSAMDIANAYAASHDSLAEFIACGVTDAHFVDTAGRLGVTLELPGLPPGVVIRNSINPTQSATFWPPELADVTPPAGTTRMDLASGIGIAPDGGLLNNGAFGGPGVSFEVRAMPAPPAPALPAAPTSSATVAGQTANPSAALSAAMAAGKYDDILKSGGNAIDVVVSMSARGEMGTTLANGKPVDLSTARLVQYDGAAAIGVTGDGGGDGKRMLIFPPEIKAYVPPGGLAGLPTVAQALGGTEPAPPPPLGPPQPGSARKHC